MNWKALAQRKFAQGAYIPPSVPPSNFPRKLDPPANKVKDCTSIILSNMSARALLDIISFKGFDNQGMQPKVLLDRLSNSEIIKNAKQKSTLPAKTITRAKIKNNTIKKKKMLNKRTVCKRHKSKPVKELEKSKKDDDFNAEDNTPLHFFAMKRLSTNNISTDQTEPENIETKLTPNVENMEVVNVVTNQEQNSSKENIEENLAQNVKDQEFIVKKKNCYYGVQGIHKWMAESIEQASGQDIPVEVNSQNNSPQKITTQSTENSDKECPSMRYKRLEDLSKLENKADYDKRCLKCIRCRCMQKMNNISTIVQEQDQLKHKNVDELSTNKEVVQESAGPSKSAGDRDNLYIDLSHRLTQIIKISKADKNGIIHAKLVPRKEAQPVNELSLAEHEHLLDQILNSLKANNSRQMITKPVIDHSTSPDSKGSPQLFDVLMNELKAETKLNKGKKGDEFDEDFHIPLSQIHTVNSQALPLPTSHATGDPEIFDLVATENDRVELEVTAPTDCNMVDMTNFQDDKIVSQKTVSNDCDMTDFSDTQNDRVVARNVLSEDCDVIDPSKSQDNLVPENTVSNFICLTETEDDKSETASSDKTRSGIETPIMFTVEGPRGIVDAPIYHPTVTEFQDPIAFIERISTEAGRFGLCKVVAPTDFRPSCVILEDIRFRVVNQYVSRLFSRWGPAVQNMCAFKANLGNEKIKVVRTPLLDGMEVNLPKLFRQVQLLGGIEEVMGKNRWGRIAEQMGLLKHPKPNKKLEQLYCKFLLPYDILSASEKTMIQQKVENAWHKRNGKILKRSQNPLHRKKRLLGESESSGDDTEDESYVRRALTEAEDCVVPGRTMSLSAYKKIAKNTMDMFFPNEELPPSEEVEAEYWKLVSKGMEHVCVNTAAIDTGEEGYCLTKDKADKYSKHAWNLKMFSQNKGNVLRSLGPVLGVTVPTLHLGMVFSTSCWHRDPHGLPWLEYMHEGPSKIWYGIPDEQSEVFRNAVKKLCPTVCQSKPIWLPSDVTMVPPELLLENNVSLSRAVQRPGEFIIVFPKAYSCSISTGFTISESVYFATESWLTDVHQLFNQLKFCCEPTMFSLEHLLVAVAQDSQASLGELRRVHSGLESLVRQELSYRNTLKQQIPKLTVMPSAARSKRRLQHGGWNIQELDECEICSSTLFFAKVQGLTNNKSSVCLEHAVHLLSTVNMTQNLVTLVTNFTDEDLEELLVSINNRAHDD